MQELRILECGDISLDLSEGPKVMGIINLNEDSFYAPSRINSMEALEKRIEEMMAEGVDILDIGAMSSRPGAQLSNPSEEAEKIGLTMAHIRKKFPNLFVSVDTVWSEVAETALLEGANMINDISSGSIDPIIHEVVANHNAPYILMHMVGVPETMQNHTHYDDVVLTVFTFFANQFRKLKQKGVHQIILDPGIGFSKGLKDNFALLKNLETFQVFDLPVLLGISRKSFIYKSVNAGPEEALNATSALHMAALFQGVNILRVHDVKEAKEVVKIAELLKKG